MTARMILWTLVACGQPEAPVKPVDPITRVEVQPVQPDATPPSDAPLPAITISPRAQMFTTKSGPGHVWFELRNTGAAASVEVVKLEYVESGIAGPIDIRSIRLDDTALAGATLTLAPGDAVLDIDFDTSMLPRDRNAYLFRVTAKVGGVEISGESTVRYARRIPIRP